MIVGGSLGEVFLRGKAGFTRSPFLFSESTNRVSGPLSLKAGILFLGGQKHLQNFFLGAAFGGPQKQLALTRPILEWFKIDKMLVLPTEGFKVSHR